MTAWPRYVTLDRALPISEGAAAGRDPHAMPWCDLLAAALVTGLEGRGDLSKPMVAAAVAHVRAALALTRNGNETTGQP